MKVVIKQFDVAMEIKNNGIEIDINDAAKGHLGDLFVTRGGLIWCRGRTRRENGKKISWNKFITSMEQK